MTLRVGFDTSGLDPQFKEHAARGIGRYVRNLDKYFREEGYIAPAIRDDCSVSYFDHRTLLGTSTIQSMVKTLPFGRQTLGQQLVYPIQLARGKLSEVDILHFPAHMDAPAWGLKPYAITVLDLIPLVCENLYRPQQGNLRFRFARYLELQAIRNAEMILAISENTARDVTRLLAVSPDRIRVTYLGVETTSSGYSATDVLNVTQKILGSITRQVILYVGGIDPRKNVPFMIDVFEQIYKETPGEKPILAISGKIDGDKEYPALLSAIEKSGCKEAIRLLGFVPDKDLEALYQTCACFFFPSLYEGFGLTPLEAMAKGAPVLSSDTSCMPEVLGEAALYFSPTDKAKAVQLLRSTLASTEIQATLREKGIIQAGKYSWKKTGAATIEAYQELAKRSTFITQTSAR